MDWLRHDQVSATELPAWAQTRSNWLDGAPYRVSVAAEGLVLRRGADVSAVRWGDVLAPIRLHEPRRLLVATARKPPRPPWFALGGRDVGAIEDAVRERLEQHGERSYRGRPQTRPVLAPDEILTAVLDREALPGAVEIPVARPNLWRQTSVTGGVIGFTAFGFISALGLGPWALLFGAVGGAGAAGAAVAAVRALDRSVPSRVLVLTPDAFVGGLDGRNVGAVSWANVGRFLEGVDDRGESALEVWGRRNNLLARVAARWFGEPLDVIVAVAEAYRRRAVAEGMP